MEAPRANQSDAAEMLRPAHKSHDEASHATRRHAITHRQVHLVFTCIHTPGTPPPVITKPTHLHARPETAEWPCGVPRWPQARLVRARQPQGQSGARTRPRAPHSP